MSAVTRDALSPRQRAARPQRAINVIFTARSQAQRIESVELSSAIALLHCPAPTLQALVLEEGAGKRRSECALHPHSKQWLTTYFPESDVRSVPCTHTPNSGLPHTSRKAMFGVCPAPKLQTVVYDILPGKQCSECALHPNSKQWFTTYFPESDVRSVPCTHTPSIAFRHLPPNSARFSYATEGALFISAQRSSDAGIVQELCESRGGRPGLSVLTSLLVSVDVKIY